MSKKGRGTFDFLVEKDKNMLCNRLSTGLFITMSGLPLSTDESSLQEQDQLTGLDVGEYESDKETNQTDAGPIETGESSKKVSKKRAYTDIQKSQRNKEKYQLLPACSPNCKFKCGEKFDKAYRKEINTRFWTLNFSERRQWLDSHINLNQIKRRTTTSDTVKRNVSLTFSLPTLDGSKQKVCKKMLLATLGFRTDGIITEFVKAKQNPKQTISPTRDNRGRNIPPNKKDRDLIAEHINSYHPFVSHYTRENAPNRRYLGAHLTVRTMYNDYCYVNKNSEIVERTAASERVGQVVVAPPRVEEKPRPRRAGETIREQERTLTLLSREIIHVCQDLVIHHVPKYMMLPPGTTGSLSLVIRDAKDDGKKVFQILKNHYGKKKGKPRILSLYTELTSLKIYSGESITDYVIRAETAATALNNADEKCSIEGSLIDSSFDLLYVRLVDDKMKPATHYMQNVNIAKADGQKIATALLSFLETHVIPVAKGVGLASDGAAVMIGSGKGRKDLDLFLVAMNIVTLTEKLTKYRNEEHDELGTGKQVGTLLVGKELSIGNGPSPFGVVQSKKDCRGKLGRWSLRLAYFDFTVKHIPGKLNVEADVLSLANISSISAGTDDMQKEQIAHENLQSVRLKEPAKFKKVEGLLYRLNYDKLLLCLPQSKTKKVWIDLHDNLGHAGPVRVLDIARQRFYWPEMRNDVKRWSKQCRLCNVNKDFLPRPAYAPMVMVDY
ncbi:hypothetical protein GQR58_024008 [Nymphon striatum]|nr:hypothetical protein GQR58_024008 [Nymphon striatum]